MYPRSRVRKRSIKDRHSRMYFRSRGEYIYILERWGKTRFAIVSVSHEPFFTLSFSGWNLSTLFSHNPSLYSGLTTLPHKNNNSLPLPFFFLKNNSFSLLVTHWFAKVTRHTQNIMNHYFVTFFSYTLIEYYMQIFSINVKMMWKFYFLLEE